MKNSQKVSNDTIVFVSPLRLLAQILCYEMLVTVPIIEVDKENWLYQKMYHEFHLEKIRAN